MKRASGALTFFLLPFFLIMGIAQTSAAPTGVIRGKLENKTLNRDPGAPGLGGVKVSLRRYLAGEEKEEGTAVTNQKGEFLFENLPTEPVYRYSVSLRYQGAEYNSPPLTFATGEREKNINISVFDSTSEGKVVELQMHHILVDVEDRRLSIREFLVFQNKSDRTYVGSREVAPDKKETLRFSLPRGAAEVELIRGLMDCCVVSRPWGFVDTMAVKPGRHVVGLGYRLPFGAKDYLFRKNLDYRAANLEVFVSDVKVGIEPQGLLLQGSFQSNGRKYLRYSSADGAAAKSIALRFTGLPTGQGIFRWVAYGIIGVIIIGGAIYSVARKKRAHEKTAQAPEEEGKDECQKVEEILHTIALLDDDFEAGKISSEEHQKERDLLKGQIREYLKDMPPEKVQELFPRG